MLEIVDEFRRRGRFVVIGGPYASLCPEELRGRCDVLFVDEAEETWPQFLADFAAGDWQSEYRPDRKAGSHHLADAALRSRCTVDRYHAMTIQFARGCPFNCEFCDIIVVYGRRPRVKSVPQVMAEIAECHRLGATQVFLVDDNFIGNKKLAKELLRAIAEWSEANGHPMYFNTEVSLNVAQDDELLELLQRGALHHHLHRHREPAEGVAAGDQEDAEHARRPGRERPQDPVVRHPGAGRHDRRLRQRRRLDLRGAAALHPGRPHPRLDDRHAAGDAEDAAPRPHGEGRPAVGESVGDQFVFSNILPKTMSRIELYKGYRRLIAELYEFRNFRRRTLEFILNRGRQVGASVRPRREADPLLARILQATPCSPRARGAPGSRCR